MRMNRAVPLLSLGYSCGFEMAVMHKAEMNIREDSSEGRQRPGQAYAGSVGESSMGEVGRGVRSVRTL